MKVFKNKYSEKIAEKGYLFIGVLRKLKSCEFQKYIYLNYYKNLRKKFIKDLAPIKAEYLKGNSPCHKPLEY